VNEKYLANNRSARLGDVQPSLRRTGIANRRGVIDVATQDAYGLSPVPFGALPAMCFKSAA
jgi:hypothetical protein